MKVMSAWVQAAGNYGAFAYTVPITQGTSKERKWVVKMETGVLISIGALLVAFLGLLLNGRKESRSDAASMAEIKTGLNTVNAGVNDIRVELRTMRESLTEHSERLARVEAKAETNSHRLDVIEGKKG